MKRMLALFATLAMAGLAGGCASYRYQVMEPPSLAHTLIHDQPVVINYDPLQYQLSRFHDHLGMTIINPTSNNIVLVGERSYVIDPRGETHPVRGRMLPPHTYVAMLFPPAQPGMEAMYPAYYGPGPWPGYPYMGGGFYYDPYFGPAVTFYHVHTPYDWNWGDGTARIHLAFDRQGTHFDHDFVILREREK